MQRVLITGAAGDVGGRITPLLKAVYPEVVLTDLKQPKETHGLRFVRADLARMDEVAAAVAGIDGIVHLGGHSIEGPWETILQANIIGCHNLFEAARHAGVRRIIFASSNHAVGFYPRRATIPPGVTVLPDSRYGVSKAFGEALGALYALKHGIGVTCLRIGNVNERPLDMRRMAIMLHPEDLVQLIRIGLEHPDIVYEVLYGGSANTRGWWDNSRARALGYRPKYNTEVDLELARAEQAKLAPDPVAEHYQGGPFCADAYTADFARLAAWTGPVRS